MLRYLHFNAEPKQYESKKVRGDGLRHLQFFGRSSVRKKGVPKFFACGYFLLCLWSHWKTVNFSMKKPQNFERGPKYFFVCRGLFFKSSEKHTDPPSSTGPNGRGGKKSSKSRQRPLWMPPLVGVPFVKLFCNRNKPTEVHVKQAKLTSKRQPKGRKIFWTNSNTPSR